MVKRNCTLDYEFHCLTDDPTGIDPAVDVIRLPKDPWIKTWWSKLWMFSSEMPLKGNILFFDLDVVIFDNIDTLFTHNPGKFNIIRDFNRCRINDWKTSNSSCMRWESGTMNYLWTEFKDKEGKARHKLVPRRMDQIIQMGDDRLQRYKIVNQRW